MTVFTATLLSLLLQDGGAISGTVHFPENGRAKLRLKIRYPDQAPRQEIMKEQPYSPALLYLEGVPSSKPAEGVVEIKQEGLQFQPRAVAIERGMRVSFPNFDKEYHNVFSYSKAKRFDLGRFPKGETREVTFDETGLVRVFCEIHEHMRAFVLVVDNPYHAAAAQDGKFSLPKVPVGAYTLVAWHEQFEPVRQKVEVKAAGVQVDVMFSQAAPAGERGERALGCCPSARVDPGP
ncbi:MAG TPA: carboxypeptidase regulatory-like domain-containing protein [Planctomycetota bacterium]|nr:carboxypeptidase regulatory-like domain-containing protein [Planctomycetota bacterium]